MPAKERCVRGTGFAHAICASFMLAVWSAAVAAPASARDKIVLPFTCTLEHGRLYVEPTVEQSYPIVGHRDQESFTYCPVWESGRCRTWTVHRFVVQCTGGRALWPEIVAAAMGRGLPKAQSRATIEGGQLMLRFGARYASRSDRWCYDGDRFPGRTMAGWNNCNPNAVGGPRNDMRTHLVALPRGFAPLSLISARISTDVEAPRPPVTPKSAAPEPVFPVPQPAAVTTEALAPVASAEVVDAPVQEPLTPQVLAPPVVPPPPLIQPEAVSISVAPSWKPWIEISQANAAQDESASVAADGMSRFIAMLLLATGALLVTGAMLRRRPSPVGWSEGHSAVFGESEAPRAVVLRTKAESQISLITNSLDRLSTVAPLRNALARDLQANERRLAVVIAGISASRIEPAAWARARRRLERIAQDLDRLQQIADSAVSSISGLRAQAELPRNKNEAYATLGVTAGVSDAILKKLVEALRISWHPDLARNDEERAVRDIRIKEINVAWDLITGKRLSE